MSEVQRAVDALYEALSDVIPPRSIEGCDHCLTEEEIGALLSTDRRDITPRQMAPYASSVFLTLGSKRDFLHFLPRILEINVIDAAFFPSPEVVGRAIATSEPASWPVAHRAAVEALFLAVVRSYVQDEWHGRIDEWMCGAARAGLDVVPLLAAIAQSPMAVIAYFDENLPKILEHKLANGFWELPCVGHDAIVEWFDTPDIRAIVDPQKRWGYRT